MSGYYWGAEQETQLKKIYDFFKNNNKNQNQLASTDIDSILSSIGDFKRDEAGFKDKPFKAGKGEDAADATQVMDKFLSGHYIIENINYVITPIAFPFL